MSFRSITGRLRLACAQVTSKSSVAALISGATSIASPASFRDQLGASIKFPIRSFTVGRIRRTAGGDASPPAVLRMRPTVNDLIGNLMLAPSWSRKEAGEAIDVAPLIKAATELFEVTCAHASRSRPVMLQKLISYKSIDVVLLEQPRCDVDNIRRRSFGKLLRVSSPNGAHRFRFHA